MTAIAIAVILLDRLSKLWVVEWLDLRHQLEMPILPPFLNFHMAWNQGVNFGIFDFGESGRWVLVALSVVIVLAVFWWMRKAGGWLMAAAVGMLAGGAMGNVWDRIQWGAVADFLNMSCCGIRNPYAFNVADIAIFAGAILLVLFGDRERKER